jgi:serine/threonine protein kinase/tetratricopeptide (TPR) repeat protein
MDAVRRPRGLRGSVAARGQPLYNPSAMRLSSGDSVGRYKVLGPLGAGGGMGVVYKARDERLGRTVALKLLPKEFVADPGRRRRFELEAQVTGQLNHPHIVAIYDAVLDDVQPYLVTELLDGEPLSAVIARGALPPARVAALGQQLADALAAAHERGIVHRDLKPDNIFVTADGRAKVLDFGLAKLTGPVLSELATASGGTGPGLAVGTVGYMAPEQVVGSQVDARADIFALGVVLHEAITGQAPFRRATAIDTLHAILHDEPPPLPAPAGGSLRSLIQRCLAKPPAERFQSARDLGFALGQSGSDAAGAPPERVRPGRARVAAGVGLLLALVLAAAWLYRRLPGATEPATAIRALAVLPLEDLSNLADQPYLADGLTEAIISDLSRFGSLRVISRASVMRYKGSKQPVREIARELGVDGLVAGTVLHADGRLQVTANLVDGETGQQLWGERYQRSFQDVLVLQSELARTVADRIALQLTPRERALLDARQSAVNAEAHELYLRGRYLWNRRDPASLRQAKAAFQEATRIAPDSALAWAGLADTHFYEGYAFGRTPPRESMPAARAAARRALELAPDMAEALTVEGLVSLFFDWDRKAAEASLRRAVLANPGYVFAHRGLAALELTRRRMHAAVANAEDAVRLDPVSPAENYFLALSYLAADDLAGAERVCRRLLELEPRYSPALVVLADVADRRRDAVEAARLYFEAAKLSGTPEPQLNARAAAISRGGLAALRDLELREMVQAWDGWHFGAYVIALRQAQAGNNEAAIEWLTRVRDARSAGIMLANGAAAFDALRSDPRFQDILGSTYVNPSGSE